MAVTGWLVDKSALIPLGDSPVADDWAERIERGLVRIATVTRLEVGHSARRGRDAALMSAVGPARISDVRRDPIAACRVG